MRLVEWLRWHGATGNATVVRALLVDLRERGLDTEAAIRVVLDGAKALHKAVKEAFGRWRSFNAAGGLRIPAE